MEREASIINRDEANCNDCVFKIAGEYCAERRVPIKMINFCRMGGPVIKLEIYNPQTKKIILIKGENMGNTNGGS